MEPTQAQYSNIALNGPNSGREHAFTFLQNIIDFKASFNVIMKSIDNLFLQIYVYVSINIHINGRQK